MFTPMAVKFYGVNGTVTEWKRIQSSSCIGDNAALKRLWVGEFILMGFHDVAFLPS